MRLIPLSQGLFAKVDDADYEWLMQWKWSASRTGRLVYAIRSTGSKWSPPRKTYSMHRVIAGVASGIKVDHWDNDGLNNQRFNLRPATNSQNNANQRCPITSTSGFKGVHWMKNRNKWHAQIRVSGVRIHLGMFEDKISAAAAYNAAALEHFGEFARLNPI